MPTVRQSVQGNVSRAGYSSGEMTKYAVVEIAANNEHT